MLAKVPHLTADWTAPSRAAIDASWPSDLGVLLLDLNIPGETYPDNIVALRALFPDTHLVAYTSYNYPDLVRETLGLGCSGYLLKQTSRDDLLDAIDAIIAGEQYVGVDPKPSRIRAAKARSAAAKSGLKDDFQKRLLLSKREKEILHLISRGCTSQQMADQLFISRYTVETHRKNILRKLNFSTSTELVKFAVEHGLV